MRPAQLTPENAKNVIIDSEGSVRFNEAGAINAGKRWLLRLRFQRRQCFNEAGAINAGKRWLDAVWWLLWLKLQ